MITSSQNDRIKHVRLLQQQARARRKHQQLVLEGARLVEDALASGARPDFVCYTESSAGLVAGLDFGGASCLLVADALMRDMADTETPQGILAVFPWPTLPLPDQPRLVLAADGWRDPGNLGTMLRTAAAAGVDLVALLPGTVDPFNPKTLRAGMGAQFRVPVGVFEWEALVARYDGLAVRLAAMDGAVAHTAVDWTQPSLLVIGGEAHGLSVAPEGATTVSIPMVAGVESLNAAVSAAVLVYEARRQWGEA